MALFVLPILSATTSCVNPARERALSIWLATWYSSSSDSYAAENPLRARAFAMKAAREQYWPVLTGYSPNP
jgi:hypothetical protein